MMRRPVSLVKDEASKVSSRRSQTGQGKRCQLNYLEREDGRLFVLMPGVEPTRKQTAKVANSGLEERDRAVIAGIIYADDDIRQIAELGVVEKIMYVAVAHDDGGTQRIYGRGGPSSTVAETLAVRSFMGFCSVHAAESIKSTKPTNHPWGNW
jgi:hypothetical protein